MKYLVLSDLDGGPSVVVFCAAPLTHRMLADSLGPRFVPVSGGFCEPDWKNPGTWCVFGYSESLRLEPAAGDELLIQAAARATARMGAPWPKAPAVNVLPYA